MPNGSCKTDSGRSAVDGTSPPVHHFWLFWLLSPVRLSGMFVKMPCLLEELDKWIGSPAQQDMASPVATPAGLLKRRKQQAVNNNSAKHRHAYVRTVNQSVTMSTATAVTKLDSAAGRRGSRWLLWAGSEQQRLIDQCRIVRQAGRAS